MDTYPSEREPLLPPGHPPGPGEDHRHLTVSGSSFSSSRLTALTIGASGPQLCYSPLLGNVQDTSCEEVASTSGGGGEGERGEHKVYTRRWYILILYSLLAGTQGLVWITFGPISATAEDAFGWSDSTVALLANWGPISYLVSGIFFCWVLDVKGLRLACLLTAVLITLGTGLRCISMDTPEVTWLMHAGQALNGLAGPVAMAGPPAVSAVWFPPHQRTTATAVGAFFGQMGSAAGFIFGPMLVPDVATNNTDSSNKTSVHSGLSYHFQLPNDYTEFGVSLWNSSLFEDTHYQTSYGETRTQRIHTEKKAIHLYMYIEAGWSAFLLVLILIYFPKKPAVPPCVSAAIPRESFFKGLKQLFMCRKPQFWILTTVYGVSTGVYNAWSGVLDVILKPHGIGQHEAGWIGFYSICGGCAMSLLVSRFADSFSRMMKWMMVLFYVIGTASFLVFALATVNIIPPSKGLFYSTIIVGSTAINGAIPLIYELGCELAYPTGEGTCNGVLTILNNLTALIFLLVFMIPGIGSQWTNYTLVAATGVCVPLLLLMKEEYNRLELDEHNPSLNAQIIVPEPSNAD